MDGKGRRSKGQSGERELAGLLSKALGHEVVRNLDQARDGGPDVWGLPGVALEVKRQERVTLEPWWEQAVQQAHRSQVPVLAYRQSRKPWRFRVPLGECVPGLVLPLDLDHTCELSLQGFLVWYASGAGDDRHEK